MRNPRGGNHNITALTRLTIGVNATGDGRHPRYGSHSDGYMLGITGPGANATLALVAATTPYAIDAVSISAEGRIAAVMPEQCWAAVGTYVGNESHNQQALQERRP